MFNFLCLLCHATFPLARNDFRYTNYNGRERFKPGRHSIISTGYRIGVCSFRRLTIGTLVSCDGDSFGSGGSSFGATTDVAFFDKSSSGGLCESFDRLSINSRITRRFSATSPLLHNSWVNSGAMES